jgi:acyl-coenzyme A thioesterase PaaI-like protein
MSALLSRLLTFYRHPKAPKAMYDRLGVAAPVSVDDETGRTRIEILAEDSHCHSNGTIVQGGFIAGWLDHAMANCVFALTDFTVQPISLDLNISYYKSAGPGVLFAEAWVAKRGTSICFLEAQLVTPGNDLLAKATSTTKLMPFPQASEL